MRVFKILYSNQGPAKIISKSGNEFIDLDYGVHGTNKSTWNFSDPVIFSSILLVRTSVSVVVCLFVEQPLLIVFVVLFDVDVELSRTKTGVYLLFLLRNFTVLQGVRSAYSHVSVNMLYIFSRTCKSFQCTKIYKT